MIRSLTQLWRDESGFVLSAELVLIATILVLGLIVGLSSLQGAVLGELSDVSNAIGSMNQSYYYKGFSGRSRNGQCGVKSWTAGSYFIDRRRGETPVPCDIIGGCQETLRTPCVDGQPCPQAVETPTPALEGPKLIPGCTTCEPLPLPDGEKLEPMADPSRGKSSEAASPSEPMPMKAPGQEQKPPRKQPSKKVD